MPPQARGPTRRTVLTDGALRLGVEVLGAHGRAGAAAGRRRRLAQPQRVFHIVVLVYGLPRVPARQEMRKVMKSHESVSQWDRENKQQRVGLVTVKR